MGTARAPGLAVDFAAGAGVPTGGGVMAWATAAVKAAASASASSGTTGRASKRAAVRAGWAWVMSVMDSVRRVG